MGGRRARFRLRIAHRRRRRDAPRIESTPDLWRLTHLAGDRQWRLAVTEPSGPQVGDRKTDEALAQCDPPVASVEYDACDEVAADTIERVAQ